MEKMKATARAALENALLSKAPHSEGEEMKNIPRPALTNALSPDPELQERSIPLQNTSLSEVSLAAPRSTLDSVRAGTLVSLPSVSKLGTHTRSVCGSSVPVPASVHVASPAGTAHRESSYAALDMNFHDHTSAMALDLGSPPPSCTKGSWPPCAAIGSPTLAGMTGHKMFRATSVSGISGSGARAVRGLARSTSTGSRLASVSKLPPLVISELRDAHRISYGQASRHSPLVPVQGGFSTWLMS